MCLSMRQWAKSLKYGLLKVPAGLEPQSGFLKVPDGLEREVHHKEILSRRRTTVLPLEIARSLALKKVLGCLEPQSGH